MNPIKALLFAVLLIGQAILLSTTALAQQWTGEIISSKAVLTNDVKLRESPPSKGFIFITSPGKEIDTIKVGERVEIIGLHVVKGLLGDNVWVRVKRLTPVEQTGWVYWGESKEKPVNFKLD
jgi:hypothetical protein